MPKNYQIFTLPLLSDNYSFIFHCLASNKVACIDPAEGEKIADFLDSKNLKLDFILNTHHHYDHIGGNKYLKEKYKCQIIANYHDKHRISDIDILLKEQKSILIGKYKFEIISLPGHTLHHIAFFNQTEKILFVGDTLFSSGCGRNFEGTYEQLYNSLQKITQLPKETIIYCAHEYSLNNIAFAFTLEPNNQDLLAKQKKCQELRAKNLPTIPTNLANELKTNPFLRTIEKDIRSSLGSNSDAYNVEIFAKLRKLKDNF